MIRVIFSDKSTEIVADEAILTGLIRLGSVVAYCHIDQWIPVRGGRISEASTSGNTSIVPIAAQCPFQGDGIAMVDLNQGR